MDRIKVLVLCGGRSGEHEISLISARSVISAIRRDIYDVAVIGIDKNGRWLLLDERDFVINPDDPVNVRLNTNGVEVLFSPVPPHFRTRDSHIDVDVIFPVLHGTYGEDGTLQGMLEMLGVPYVGANHLASAIGMDKEVSKRLFREAGLDVVKYIALHFERDASCLNHVCDRVEREIGFPCFVKPANLGSSVGTNKVHNRDELTPALLDAWQYDLKILVEEAINAREIECSLLGNSSVLASCLGEIVPRHEFYSYEAKYLDPNGAELIIGADVEEGLARRIQDAAKRAFEAIGCEGMARADFLVDKEKGIPYINEVNTIPGFTKISMYPKLLEKSGIPYHELIDRLIKLALERHELKRRLKTDFKRASR